MTLIARIICGICACDGVTKWLAKNGSEHGNQLGHIQLIDESIFPLKFNGNGFVLVEWRRKMLFQLWKRGKTHGYRSRSLFSHNFCLCLHSSSVLARAHTHTPPRIGLCKCLEMLILDYSHLLLAHARRNRRFVEQCTIRACQHDNEHKTFIKKNFSGVFFIC